MQNTTIKKHVIGIDISNEQTTLAIVDVRGNIIAQSYFATATYPDISLFVARLTEEVITLAEGHVGYENIRSIGISCPSASVVSGCIENAPNLPWKGMVPMQAMLRDRLGLAVAISNDAHVAALGEKIYGSAHGMKDFIVICLGVGLGSCFYSNGVVHEGIGGYAGEIGHTCVVDHGRKCSCGLEGCLEAYAGANGIVQTAQEVMAESDKPSLMRDMDHLSPRTIKECCDKGDELAILTGGISHAGDWLIVPTQESFEQHVFHNMRGKVKLVVTELDDHERDVLGASALAWEVPEYSLFK